MRTTEAARNRNRMVRRAKKMGHDPILLSNSGAMELWVCRNCQSVMDCWDSPTQTNGPMPHVACSNNLLSRSQVFGFWVAVVVLLASFWGALIYWVWK